MAGRTKPNMAAMAGFLAAASNSIPFFGHAPVGRIRRRRIRRLSKYDREEKLLRRMSRGLLPGKGWKGTPTPAPRRWKDYPRPRKGETAAYFSWRGQRWQKALERKARVTGVSG